MPAGVSNVSADACFSRALRTLRAAILCSFKRKFLRMFFTAFGGEKLGDCEGENLFERLLPAKLWLPVFGETGPSRVMNLRERTLLCRRLCLSMSSSGKASSSGDDGAGRLSALHDFILDNIVNRLEEARDIARVQSVCRELNQSGRNVLSLRIICLDEYHERARSNSAFQGKSFRLNVSDGYGPSTSGSSSSGSSSSTFLSFKDVVVGIIKSKPFLVQLRLEVEPNLQSKLVSEGERRRTDFWLTDHYFLSKWLPHTLQHLCIVDYGQQAIMRRSKIIKLLSEMCKLLKTLDLRNLFIDTSEMDSMPSMVSLTLRCVKVVAHTLQHLNENMPNLQTLALLGVFGADKGGTLEFQNMKVLCLGLSTRAQDVVMKCPNLEKLQLKMQCPQKLIITAQKLKYVAFNLDVIEPSKVDLISMVGLQELLYGATSFLTLTSLIDRNFRNLKKVFLDVPCMALAEDGRFLGVLKDTTLQLPSFNKLHECNELEVLNIGPGLWYSMETQVQELLSTDRWPSMKSLVLHMIPHDMEASIVVLRTLLRVSVTSLVVFIHKSSPMTEELMAPKIEEIVRSCDHINHFKIDSWQKSLNFSCFSF